MPLRYCLDPLESGCLTHYLPICDGSRHRAPNAIIEHPTQGPVCLCLSSGNAGRHPLPSVRLSDGGTSCTVLLLPVIVDDSRLNLGHAGRVPMGRYADVIDQHPTSALSRAPYHFTGVLSPMNQARSTYA